MLTVCHRCVTIIQQLTHFWFVILAVTKGDFVEMDVIKDVRIAALLWLFSRSLKGAEQGSCGVCQPADVVFSVRE